MPCRLAARPASFFASSARSPVRGFGAMEVLLYLVPLALGLGLLGLGAFLWSAKSGQFDDLDRAAWHAILDDDEPAPPPKRVPPGAPVDVSVD